jgi:hypothetical protein
VGGKVGLQLPPRPRPTAHGCSLARLVGHFLRLAILAREASDEIEDSVQPRKDEQFDLSVSLKVQEWRGGFVLTDVTGNLPLLFPANVFSRLREYLEPSRGLEGRIEACDRLAVSSQPRHSTGSQKTPCPKTLTLPFAVAPGAAASPRPHYAALPSAEQLQQRLRSSSVSGSAVRPRTIRTTHF